MSKKDDETYVPSRYKKEDALRDLDDLGSFSIVLPSSIAKIEESKKEESAEIDEPVYDGEWMETLVSLRTEKKAYKHIDDLFGDNDGSKKKKKKKKNKDGPKDHTEDFEKEVALLQDILKDQAKLSDSLQERYDILNRQKSSARGVGKFTTDLISTLNTSRSLCKDIVKELANIKKTTAELNMKEREKFGKLEASDSEDMNNFASSYLKKIMGVNADLSGGSGDFEIDDVNDAEEFFSDLEFNMKSSENFVDRSSDATKYLKYENQKVEIKVIYDEDSDTKEFIAETEDGDILEDYPLPSTANTLSINRSTGIATDKYGQKYKVIYQ